MPKTELYPPKVAATSGTSLPEAPHLAYRDLAWWAESADGAREEDLVLVERKANETIEYTLERASAANATPDRKVVLTGIRVKAICPKRPKISKVLVQVDNKIIECTIDGQTCDAVFCSESAIEKFLFPYYHAQRLLTEREWEVLKAALADEQVVAIEHGAPSRSIPVRTENVSEQIFGILRIKGSRDSESAGLECLSPTEYRKRFIDQGASR